MPRCSLDDRTVKLWERLDHEYAEFRMRVQIDRTKLSEEVLQHSESRRRISENWVYAKRVLSTCIRDKATSWATRAAELRGEQHVSHRDDKGIKPTKDTVENAVRSDKSYLDACRNVVDAQESAELWEALADNFRGRGFDLRDLVKIHLAGMERDFIKDEPGPLRRAYQRPEAPAAEEPASEDKPTERRRFKDG